MPGGGRIPNVVSLRVPGRSSRSKPENGALVESVQVLDSRVVFVRGFYEDRHSPSPSPAASPALELNSPKGDCLRVAFKIE